MMRELLRGLLLPALCSSGYWTFQSLIRIDLFLNPGLLYCKRYLNGSN